MKRKSILIILSLIAILLVCGYRYSIINKNIPSKYVIDKYFIGQNIKLDDMEIKVTSFKKPENNLGLYDNNFVPILLDINIKNTSSNTVIPGPIIESKLNFGISYVDYAEPTGDVNKLNKLLPNEEANLTLTYLVNKDLFNNNKDKSELQLYITTSLYKSEIIKKIKEQQIYAKSIVLKGE